jgi:hypothetical protein
MINVGIDVHKKRCQACLKDEKNRLIEELIIPNTTEGAEQLARMITIYGEAKSRGQIPLDHSQMT